MIIGFAVIGSLRRKRLGNPSRKGQRRILPGKGGRRNGKKDREAMPAQASLLSHVLSYGPRIGPTENGFLPKTALGQQAIKGGAEVLPPFATRATDSPSVLRGEKPRP